MLRPAQKNSQMRPAVKKRLCTTAVDKSKHQYFPYKDLNDKNYFNNNFQIKNNSFKINPIKLNTNAPKNTPINEIPKIPVINKVNPNQRFNTLLNISLNNHREK